MPATKHNFVDIRILFDGSVVDPEQYIPDPDPGANYVESQNRIRILPMLFTHIWKLLREKKHTL